MADRDPGVSPANPAPDVPARPVAPTPGLSPMPLDLFRTGDRAAAAEYITKNAPLIRRRLRGKIARSLRSLFDSDDLMATVSRRLDDIIRRRELTATSEGELWSLLEHLAMNALSDLARRNIRERPANDPEGTSAQPAAELEPKTDPDGPDSLVSLCLAELRLEADQRILRMRLDHHTHAQIAAAEGISETTVRKRWQRIRRAIRTVLGLIDPPTHHPRRPEPRTHGRQPHPSGNPPKPHADAPSHH